MAPLLEDPRIRQTWNHLSHNAETATESAAAGIWTFTHEYIGPCFTSIGHSINSCTAHCFPDREERARRLRERERTRSRAEYSFDFYDDWDEEESRNSGGLLGWGNDELDRLLAGSGSHSHRDDQPSGRKRGMSYGTRSRGQKRKGTIDGMPDPTIIPSTSALGFLQRLPWKIGGTLRYKPSAADLQDHPGIHRDNVGDDAEIQPFIDDDHSEDDEEGDLQVHRTRQRSSTTGSGDTSDSFRSRGDLFPSDGEDDAVPISDEFAMALERRNTMTAFDDRSSGKTRSSKGKNRAGSRVMSRTMSRTSQTSNHSMPGIMKRDGSASKLHISDDLAVGSPDVTSLADLEHEEERLRAEQDAKVEIKRQAAIHLAAQRGLKISGASTHENKQDVPVSNDISPITTENDRDKSLEQTTPVSIVQDPQPLPDEDKEVFVPARLPNFR
jgi:hypothetical protein